MGSRSFMDLLVIPWVDKTIAIVAAIPFVIELYRRWVVGHVNFPRAVLGLQLLVIIIVMVLRTAPVRVTPNPWYWLLAFVTTYATLGFSAYAEPGVTLISPSVGNGVAVVSVIIILYSLLSLGRNIGFVPAQRRIVTRVRVPLCQASDLYRHVRISTGIRIASVFGAQLDDGSGSYRAANAQRSS